jgi:hypothetical protein
MTDRDIVFEGLRFLESQGRAPAQLSATFVARYLRATRPDMRHIRLHDLRNLTRDWQNAGGR